ncbi:LacI family DNA-binding transcriptional regulator [Paeniglutamicibacter sulfureus]|uniref:LacI family transcriptional regulator n=2 Tax=Paeniglutamicibacter sulfureus TaxID=43666 RepID=A0ABU2BFM2_9MICC|nr:LacI family DNA-binding transcriptional regulator [Paeniglutamicibacter sulfureus]MDR7357440.1 LacI family transcriptional regulator [Paeniglutamicibacter sulfureus]
MTGNERGEIVTTMNDVARIAGVSGSTVSHVLNGTRAVRETTRIKVLAAIESTGYRRNGLARSLAMQRTQTLGLAISVLSNPYFGSLVNTIEKVATTAGYNIVLADTHDDPERESRTIGTLLDRQIDGLILAPAGGSHGRHDTLEMVRASRTPMVLIDRFLDFPCDQYAPENYEPVKRLTAHLLELGHRKIAAIIGARGLSTTVERRDGFYAAVAEAGVERSQVLFEEGHSTAEGGHAAMARLLQSVEPPTAIVSMNNAMTIGVMKALRDAGLRVPRDVALVGFDDFEWADSFEPRLTTMAQDVETMGAEAVQMLLDRIVGSDAPFARHSIAPFMRHRNSCGCAD